MATSTSTSTTPSPARSPLRLRLSNLAGGPDGSWWPQSRDLQTEAADLVDHFPPEGGHIRRMLFSRPDWDDAVADGSGVRKIRAARGPVKVGSFPTDDTQLMILTMASGQRLKLQVIPSDISPVEGRRRLQSGGGFDATQDGGADRARWDNESPGS
jgi:hypothetical protein